MTDFEWLLLTPEVDEEAFTCPRTTDCSPFPAVTCVGVNPDTVIVPGEPRDAVMDANDPEFYKETHSCSDRDI